MSPLLVSVLIGVVGTFIAVPIALAIGQMFQLWRVLPERTVLVYTFFGKVVGQVEEPGLFFPIAHFGPRPSSSRYSAKPTPSALSSTKPTCAISSLTPRKAPRWASVFGSKCS